MHNNVYYVTKSPCSGSTSISHDLVNSHEHTSYMLVDYGIKIISSLVRELADFTAYCLLKPLLSGSSILSSLSFGIGHIFGEHFYTMQTHNQIWYQDRATDIYTCTVSVYQYLWESEYYQDSAYTVCDCISLNILH